MARFNLTILVATLFCVSTALVTHAAPASSGTSQLGRRGLVWPGRIFGSDRWGLVLGPRPQVALGPTSGSDSASSSSVDPAVNPAQTPDAGVASSVSRTTIIVPPPMTTPPTLPATVSSSVAELSTSAAVFSSAAASSDKSAATVSTDPAHVLSTPTSNSPKKTSPPVQSSSHVAPPPSLPKPTPSSISTHQPAPAPTHTSTQSTPPPAQSATPSGPTDSSDISQYLQGHNDERAQHGAQPLTWSNDLAAKAQQWVDNCKFQHSMGTLGPLGENLAAGTGTFTIAHAISSWNAESAQYNPSNPQASHFTQVVWKATTEVGCAVQTCNGIFPSGPATYYVCEYSPQGNVVGEIAQNVQA